MKFLRLFLPCASLLCWAAAVHAQLTVEQIAVDPKLWHRDVLQTVAPYSPDR